jgi:hypothetical protein
MLGVDYESQYQILLRTQSLLEQASFDFAKRTLPSVLSEHGWDCAEAAELDLIVKAMSAHQQKLDSTLEPKTKPIRAFITGMTELRNVTVHRHRLSAKHLDHLLHTAVDFLATLDDGRRLEQMKKLYNGVRDSLLQLDINEKKTQSALNAKELELDHRIRELKQHKETLRSTAEATLRQSQSSASTQLNTVLDSAIPLVGNNGLLWYSIGQCSLLAIAAATILAVCFLS